MSYTDALFLGGGPLSGWHTVDTDQWHILAREVPPLAAAFRDSGDPFAPFERGAVVQYTRVRLGGIALAGHTHEVTIVDGWLIPWTPEAEHAVYLLNGTEPPPVMTFTIEAFMRLPGLRLQGLPQ